MTGVLCHPRLYLLCQICTCIQLHKMVFSRCSYPMINYHPDRHVEIEVDVDLVKVL